MVDKDGFRANVAIVIGDGGGRLLWAKRIGQPSWQFPQGGINPGESVKQALYRELHEEVGLEPADVKVLGESQKWLRYHIPRHLQRKKSSPLCIGQKQKWFYLQLVGTEDAVKFNATEKPEFDDWSWVNYWYPVHSVVSFKRNVYRRALREFASLNAQFENSPNTTAPDHA